MRTPIDLRMAWVSASVLLISKLYISEPDIQVNGVSEPKACANAMAIAVFPKKNLIICPINNNSIGNQWVPNYLCQVRRQVEQTSQQFSPLLSYLIRHPLPCELSIGQPVLVKPTIKQTYQTLFNRKYLLWNTNISWFPVVLQPKSTYVRMGTDTFYSGNLPDFLHFGYRRCLKSKVFVAKMVIYCA